MPQSDHSVWMLRWRLKAAEAERDALAVSIGFWEAEVARLREAADAAMHELGVPQDHLTPAPVGNAYEILRVARAALGEDA